MNDQSIEDVHWTMNGQWIELNGGGLLPAQNVQTSNSCTGCAVTALCMLHVETLVKWDKNTINNILNTGSVNNTKVIA
jgi:hypothetical protein